MEENIFNQSEIEVISTDNNTFYSGEHKKPKPDKHNKPCPPGHWIGKGHYKGDKCNCEGDNDVPTATIDVGMMTSISIGIIMILITRMISKLLKSK